MVCPLLQGSPRPLLRQQKICAEIHGDSGLNTHVSLDLPDVPTYARNYVNHINGISPSSTKSSAIHFTTQMYRYFSSFANGPTPEKITIITTGPLTNVALLLINHPEVTNMFFFRKSKR